MGNTICTAGFPSAAMASSCFTARCASIWYGFFIATLLFSAKENCSQPIKRLRAGSRYFLRSTGQSRRAKARKSIAEFDDTHHHAEISHEAYLLWLERGCAHGGYFFNDTAATE